MMGHRRDRLDLSVSNTDAAHHHYGRDTGWRWLILERSPPCGVFRHPSFWLPALQGDPVWTMI